MLHSFSWFSAERKCGRKAFLSPLKRLTAVLLALLLLLTSNTKLIPVASAAGADEIQIGDYLQLGHISFSTGYSGNNDRDMTWQVIGEENGKLLLFLADNLFAGPYDASDHAVQNSGFTVYNFGSSSWRTCDIRTWFNSSAEYVRYDTCSHFDYTPYGVGMAQIDDFGTKDEPTYSVLPGFLNGFSVPELCLIETTAHEFISARTEDVQPCRNWEAADYGTDFENAADIYSQTQTATIEDEVFLLSAQEYRKYVVEQGLQQDVYVPNRKQFVSANFWLSDSLMYDGYGIWLFYGMCNLYVNDRHQPAQGYNGNHGVLVRSDNVWLRPACWIDASYITEIDGAGTITDPYTLTIDPSVLSRAASKNIYQEHPDKWVITVMANKRDPGSPNSKDAYRLAPNATITTEAGVFTTNDLGWAEVPFSYGGATISLPGYYDRTLDCMQMSENQKVYLEPESDEPTLLACWVGNHDVLHERYTLDILVTPDSLVKAEFHPGKDGGGSVTLTQSTKTVMLDKPRGRKVTWGNESDQLDPSTPIYIHLFNGSQAERVSKTLQLSVLGVTPEELPSSVSFSFFGKGSGIEISSLGDKAKAFKDIELKFDLKLPVKAECEVEDGKFYFVAGLAPSFKKDASSGKTSGENTDKEGGWKLSSGIDMLSDIIDNKNQAMTNYKTLKDKKAFASMSESSLAFTAQFQILYYAEGYVNAEGKAVVTNQGGIVGGGAGGQGRVPLGISIGPIPTFVEWSFGADAAYKFRMATSDLVTAATRAVTPDANLNVKFQASGSVNAGVSDVVSVGIGIKGKLVFSMDFKQFQLTSATIDGDINPFVTGQVLWFSGETEIGSLKELLNVQGPLYEWPESHTQSAEEAIRSASASLYEASAYRPAELKTGGAVELGSDYTISELAAGYVSSDPQLLELEDGKRLVFYIAPASSVDGLVLTAKYFDGESWSGPIPVENNGTADLYPAAYVANGTAWVVWTDLSGSAEGLALDEIGVLTRIHAASFDPETNSFTPREISQADGTAQLIPVLGTLNGELQIAWRANAGGDWFGCSGAEIRTCGTTDGVFEATAASAAAYTVSTPISSMVIAGDKVFWTADTDSDFTTSEDTELFCNGTRLTDNDVPDCALNKAVGWVYWLQDNKLMSVYYSSPSDEPYDDEAEITGLFYKILSSGDGTRLVLWIDQPVDENEQPVGGTCLYARYYNYSDRTWADETFCLTDGSASVLDYSASLDSEKNLQIAVLAENPEQDGYEIYTIQVPYATDLSLDSVEYSGACYIDDNALDLTLTLKNHGTESVNSYLLTVTDNEGNTLLRDIRNQTVDPGQTLTVILPFDVTEAAANVNLHATVTPAGTADTDPDNNSCDFTLNWEDLNLENLHWALQEDDSVAVIGTVVNRGYGSYNSITVTLREGTPDGEILQTQTLPGLDTLAAKGVCFVVPFEEDAVYYVRIEQADTDDRSGNDYDFVVLQTEEHWTWGDGLPCNGDNCPGKVFTDMPPRGNWAHDPIDWALVHNITAGTTATTFSPKKTCTRAEIVTFLWKAAGSPEPTTTDNPFQDVASNKYYYKAVLWAAESGITSGTSATTFSPKQTCTRAQVMTFLWSFAGRPEPTTGTNPFEDVPSGKYYAKAVMWAAEKGITGGTSSTTFSPNNTCTRAQIVTFLYKYMVG